MTNRPHPPKSTQLADLTRAKLAKATACPPFPQLDCPTSRLGEVPAASLGHGIRHQDWLAVATRPGESVHPTSQPDHLAISRSGQGAGR